MTKPTIYKTESPRQDILTWLINNFESLRDRNNNPFDAKYKTLLIRYSNLINSKGLVKTIYKPGNNYQGRFIVKNGLGGRACRLKHVVGFEADMMMLIGLWVPD